MNLKESAVCVVKEMCLLVHYIAMDVLFSRDRVLRVCAYQAIA